MYPTRKDKGASLVAPVPLLVLAPWPLHVLVAPAEARAVLDAVAAGPAVVPASAPRPVACTAGRPPRSCSDGRVHPCGQTPSGT